MARKYTITQKQLRKMRKHAQREQYKAAGMLGMWMRRGQMIGRNQRAFNSKTACRKKVNSDD